IGAADVRILHGGIFSGALSSTTGRLRQTQAGTLTLTGGAATMYGMGVGPAPGDAFVGGSVLVIDGKPLTLTSTATGDTGALVASLAAIVRVQNGGRLSFASGATAQF